MRLLIAILTLHILLISTLSGEQGSSPFNPETLGMGNTWMAIPNSVLTTSLNPSFLGMPFQNPFRITTAAMLNGDAFQLLKSTAGDIKKYSDTGLASAPDSLISRLTSFRALYAGGVDLSYRGEGFGITIYANGHGQVSFSGALAPEGSVFLDQDTGIVVGFGIPVTISKRGNFAFYTGINLRYINRIRFQKSGVSFEDSKNIVDPFEMNLDYLVGQAISSDVSATIIVNNFTIALSWRNWFGMGFSWKKYNSQKHVIDNNVNDTHVPQSLDVGLAWNFHSLLGLSTDIFSETVFTLDVHDFFIEENSFFNMIHIGLKTTLLNFLTIKAGFNKGYPTFGLSTTIAKTIQLEYAIYTIEKGIMPGQDPASFQMFSISIIL